MRSGLTAKKRLGNCLDVIWFQGLKRWHGPTGFRINLALDFVFERLDTVFGYAVQLDELVDFFLDDLLAPEVTWELVFQTSQDHVL